jgi:hypothetical protein
MTFTYDKLIRQAAIRINAITGSTKAAKETSYGTAPLTATQLGSIDFPITALRDAAISTVAKIIRFYANLDNHPFKNFHTTTTANIAHKGNIPSVSSTNKPIIGNYGAVKNASTGEIMTEQPLQIIKTIVDNTDTFLKGSYDHYKIIGRRLHHTAANATIDVVTFSESDERTAAEASGGVTPLPDAVFDIAWCNMVSLLIIDDEFTNQASLYGNYVQNELNALAGGATNFAPAPTLINTSAPGVS